MAQRPGGKVDASKLKADAKQSKQTVAKAAAKQKAEFAALQARKKVLGKVVAAESVLRKLAGEAKAAEAKVVRIETDIKKIEAGDAKLAAMIAKAKAAAQKAADAARPEVLVKLEDTRTALQLELVARQKRRDEERTNLQRLGRKAEKVTQEYYREVRQVQPDIGPPPPPPAHVVGWNAAFLLALVTYCMLAKKRLG